MDQGSHRSGDRFQVRLWDLAVVVVGSAIVLDAARRSRAAWGGGWPGVECVLGLVVLTLGVGLGLVEGGRGVGRLRAREGRAWAATWRVLAMAWLAWAVLDLASALQVRPDAIPDMVLREDAHMRLRLVPLMTAMGLVGLVLATTPLRRRPRTSASRPAVGSGPTILLSGVAGLVLLAAANGVIYYLVLIAIDAVWNSFRMAPRLPQPHLSDRLARLGLETLPGLLGCLATASWVDDDLRAAARDPIASRAARSWAGVLARASTAILAGWGAVSFLLVSLPRLNPSAAEGSMTLIGTSTGATIALGFAALAAGFSARSAAHLAAGAVGLERPELPSEPGRGLGPWPRWIIGGLVGLVAAEVIAAALQAIFRDDVERWYIPFSLHGWSRVLIAPARW